MADIYAILVLVLIVKCKIGKLVLIFIFTKRALQAFAGPFNIAFQALPSWF